MAIDTEAALRGQEVTMMSITVYDAAPCATQRPAPVPTTVVGEPYSHDDFASWLSATPVWRQLAATLGLPVELQSAAASYSGYEEWRNGQWRYRPAGWVANGCEPLAPLAEHLRGKKAGSPGLEHIDPAAFAEAVAVGLSLYIGVTDADTFMRGDVPNRHVAIAINEDGTRAAVLWDSRKPMLAPLA